MNGAAVEDVVHQLKSAAGSVITTKCGMTVDERKERIRRTSWNDVTCEACLDQTLARIRTRPADYEELANAYKRRK